MKRFLLRLLFYMLPLLVAVAYYYHGVDQKAVEGDIGRMTQLEFKYTVPVPNGSLHLAECRDVEIDSIGSLSEDEMVVFGDSFSSPNERKWPGCRWLQYMGDELNKSIVNVRAHRENPADKYLTMLTHHRDLLSDTVVIECVERYLIERLCALDFDNVPDYTPTRPSKAKDWRSQLREEAFRPVQYYQRRLGIDVPVEHGKLDRPFFSVRPTDLFYFNEDMIPREEWEVEKAYVNLCRLDSLSRTKGITLFFVAIPDKYTVYHRHLVDTDNSKRQLESPCRFDSLDCFINVLPVLSQLVENGVLDVYLPDDTHFSYIGAEATGRCVAGRLTPDAKFSEE